MNRNLFLMELKQNALSLLMWMVVVIVLISVTMAVYPVFMENQSKVMGMLTIIPKGALQFKGISNFTDLLSVLGFYAANNVIYMMVLGSIYSIVLASNILLKEEYNKTAEYLLSWPVSRTQVFMSKAGILALNIFLLNLVTSLVGLIWLHLVKTDPFSLKAFIVLSTYTFLLNLFFGATGLLISTFIKRARPITTFCIGLVLIFYFTYTLSKITESIAWIGNFTPFKYARIDAISPDYGLDLNNLLVFGGFIILSIWIALTTFRKKDIML